MLIDEKEEGDESPKSNSSGGENYKGKSASNVSKSPGRASEADAVEENPEYMDIKEEDVKVPLHAQCSEPVSFIYMLYNILAPLFSALFINMNLHF